MIFHYLIFLFFSLLLNPHLNYKIQRKLTSFIKECFTFTQLNKSTIPQRVEIFLSIISIISTFFYGEKYPIDLDIISLGLSIIIEISRRNLQKGEKFPPLILREILHISNYLLNHLQNLNTKNIHNLIEILTFLTKRNCANEIVHLNSFQFFIEAQKQWGDSMNELSSDLFKCLSYLIPKAPETIDPLCSFGIIDHAIFVFDNGSYQSRINSGYFFVSLADQSFWNTSELFFTSNQIVFKLGFLLETEILNDLANVFAYGLNQIAFNLLHSSRERNELLIQQYCSSPFEAIFNFFHDIENQIVAQSIQTLHNQIVALIPQYLYSIHS